MRQKSPSLERAAKLAAGHHLLTRITAFFEVDATYRFIIEHLWHKGIRNLRTDRGNTAAHLAPGPNRWIQRLAHRQSCAHRRHPKAAPDAISGVQHHQIRSI